MKGRGALGLFLAVPFFVLGYSMAPKEPKPASLVASNARNLWMLLAANIVGFYFAAHWAALSAGEWPKLMTGLIAAVPAGVGVALTSLLNTLVSADTKAML